MFEYCCQVCWESFMLFEVIEDAHCPYCGSNEFTYQVVINEDGVLEKEIYGE